MSRSISMAIAARVGAVLLGLGIGAEASAACDTPAHRAFDFWLGTWEVRTPDGRLAGRNRIDSEYGGCVLHERYRTERSYRGESLNVYDAGRQVWHQTWVDNAGTLLLLEGGLVDGSMVLEGQTRGPDGVTRHRIRWTPRPDGSVRQHWQSLAEPPATDPSAAGAGAWRTVFDGLYTRP